jgi:hypothetical protein
VVGIRTAVRRGTRTSGRKERLSQHTTTNTTASRPANIAAIPRRRWIRLAYVYLCLGAAALLYAPRAANDAWWIHGVWCAAGLAVAIPMLLQAFKRGFSVVVTDHRFMFLAVFCMYFLFGAAILSLGSEQEVAGLIGLYPIWAGDALRVDGINALGFGIALLTSSLASGRWMGTQSSRVARQVGRMSPTLVVGAFLFVGTAITLYRLPADLGLRPDDVSGTVRALGQLSLVAIVLAASSRGRHERALRWCGVLLTLLLIPLGALRLMKAEILIPMVALTAGLALRFGSRRVLPVGVSVIVLSYLMLGDVVNYARFSTAMGPGGSPVSERWASLKEGWVNAQHLPQNQQYGHWARLCYVPTQAASLDFQDQGNGGDGMRLLLWTFVPRFIAPNKPQMTEMFSELNEKITGSDQSSTAPGIFASGYYHGGWWGFLLASVLFYNSSKQRHKRSE